MVENESHGVGEEREGEKRENEEDEESQEGEDLRISDQWANPFQPCKWDEMS